MEEEAGDGRLRGWIGRLEAELVNQFRLKEQHKRRNEVGGEQQQGEGENLVQHVVLPWVQPFFFANDSMNETRVLMSSGETAL